ncbi:MAG: PQQ-binding-like beta-propeller repeat protein [bacterium]|nr:PQQ-binding-like beta-propeller repeat protein [bacterium]
MAARDTWWILWLLAPAIAPCPAPGADWPQFGGPNRDLKVTGTGLFDGREIELEVLWRRPLGPGYSAIAITGDIAVTSYSDGTSDVLVALRASDGTEIWRRVIGPTYRGHSGSDDGPLGTPTIHGGSVFAVGRRGELLAVRLADGEQLWSLKLDRDFDAPAPRYGFSTSPFVTEGVLIVQAGGAAGKSVAGLDPASGELLWSRGDEPVDHQSPLPASFAGADQVLAVGRREMTGIQPRTGEVLWRHRYREELEAWAQPVVIGGEGVFMSYYDVDGAFFRVAAGEKGFEIEPAWRSELLKRSHVVPIHDGGCLYGFRGSLLFCVDPATGKEVWGSRQPGNGGTILVDGHLVNLAPRGQLVITEVSRRGTAEKARVQVFGRGGLTPPSVAGKRFFVRNLQEAACVVLRDGSL